MEYMSPSFYSPSPIVQPAPHIQTAQAYLNNLNTGYTNTNTNTNQYGLRNQYSGGGGGYSNQYLGTGYTDTDQYRPSGYANTNTNQYIDYYYDDTTDDLNSAYNNYNSVTDDFFDRDEEAIDDTNIDTAYLIAKTFPEVFVLFSYGLALTIIIYGSLSFIEPYVGCPASRELEEESNNRTKMANLEIHDEESFIKQAFDIVNGVSEESSARKESSFIFFVDSYDHLLEQSKSSFSGAAQPVPLSADPRLFSLACGAVSRPFITAFLVVWLPIIVFCFITGYFVTDVNLFRKKDQDIEAVNLLVDDDYDYLDSPGSRSWRSRHSRHLSY